MKLRLGNEENARHYGVETGDMIDISFQDYLKGVVASEIGNAHIEACKAQAIASRTNTYAYLKSNKTISDSSKDIQAFRAERLYGYPNAYRAVEETNGQV